MSLYLKPSLQFQQMFLTALTQQAAEGMLRAQLTVEQLVPQLWQSPVLVLTMRDSLRVVSIDFTSQMDAMAFYVRFFETNNLYEAWVKSDFESDPNEYSATRYILPGHVAMPVEVKIMDVIYCALRDIRLFLNAVEH